MLLVVAADQSVYAGTNTFTGTGTTSWNLPGNWSSGTLPAASDALLINSTSLNAGTTETLDASDGFQSLSFDLGSSSVSLNANASGR